MTARIGWRIEHEGCVGSTQDLVFQRLRQTGGAEPEGLVIAAEAQVEGRGRMARKWESAPGNLYLSMLLRPEGYPQCFGHYAQLLPVALADTLEGAGAGPEHIGLKWPNDVLLGGRKCAGILIEVGGDALVAGMGVNLRTAPETGAAVAEFTQALPERGAFLEALLENIGEVLARYRGEGFAPIRERWLARAVSLGRPVEIRLGGKAVAGTFRGIDLDGAMELVTDAGSVRRITGGEVSLVERKEAI